ncbi:MAG: SCO family protein [Spirochaetota bacterium]
MKTAKYTPLHASLLMLSLFITPLFSHGGTHATNEPDPIVGIEEKKGSTIPLDTKFVDEYGGSVLLKDVVQGPTILCFVFYTCRNECLSVVTSLSSALRSCADKPGSEPAVVTISIDDREKPADALKIRTIAFEAIQKPYPQDRWHFLIGSAASVKQVTDAAGFRFARRGNDFDHPLGLIILSPTGKVVRYIHGTEYLPMEITMSLMEARTGTIQPTIARALRMCFSYDPKSHRYVFNLLRVSASVIIVFIGIFIAYLVISSRRRRNKG